MLTGLSGVNTCDLVIDSSGNAVDCSQVSNIFSLACWNPLSPCASSTSTAGAPGSVDCSLSQLGPTLCNLLENNQGPQPLGISLIVWVLIGAGLLVLISEKKR